jgi:hypothetical protein
MLGAAQTGDALPATDLDSHERLVNAWMQYRDSYGNNALASGLSARLTASEADNELEDPAFPDLSRQPSSAVDEERAVVAEAEAPAAEMAASAPDVTTHSGANQPYDISMWAP